MTALEYFGDGLRVFLGVAFVWYGYHNVRPSPDRKAEYVRWGFAPWVQPAGGVLQLIAVALLVLPATVTYGAALLFAMMAFSVYIHLARAYSPREVPVPVILAALAVIAGAIYGGPAFGPVGYVFHSWFG